MTTTILTNATLILEDELVEGGTIVFDAGGIRAVDSGRSALPEAVDVGGDYVAPGLVEMHTDNLEKHFVPRPSVFWPNGLAAALVHDAQMAAAGVTTVYDAVCAGTVFGAKDYRREIFPQMIDAIGQGLSTGAFRIDHRVHIRAELTGDDVVGDIEPYMDNPLVRLVSLMDHTPGQRQWRDVKHLETYNVGSGEKTLDEHRRDVAERMELGPRNARRNWPIVVDLVRSRGIPLATHDDTEVQHIEAAVQSGAVISEFPTTVEAARAAREAGLATVAGGPNIVRGGSHSGGVAAAELATSGLLDGISSDYVPASLLQAVHALWSRHGIALPEAMAKVTWRTADMVGLHDRGRLKPGQRADVLRFRFMAGTPIIEGLWSAGRRAF
jgi:alpha-D-ribose 1-methylphosphonate 5-triphosphate diphosphatase